MNFKTIVNQKIALFFLVALALDSTSVFATQSLTGKVIKLSDGDTIQFLAAGETKPLKVRMVAIDTAELHFPVPGGIATQGYWGERGADELAKYIAVGDPVVLEVFGQDKYKRTLGRIFKKGEDINLKMIHSGWAALYNICEAGVDCRTGDLTEKDLKAYRAACDQAVKKGLGLFDPSRPVPELPFVFRARENKQGLSKFVADLSQNTYAKPNEYESVSVCNRLFYLSEADVVKNGFTRK